MIFNQVLHEDRAEKVHDVLRARLYPDGGGQFFSFVIPERAQENGGIEYLISPLRLSVY